jgi:hypothetical protein
LNTREYPDRNRRKRDVFIRLRWDKPTRKRIQPRNRMRENRTSGTVWGGCWITGIPTTTITISWKCTFDSYLTVSPFSLTRRRNISILVLEWKPCFSVKKFEIRSTKYEAMTKTSDFQSVSLGHFVIWYSDLFRISHFDIRILPEHYFSFRHYII